MENTKGSNYYAKRANVCAVLADKVKEYFKDDSHKAAFEEWYRKKYGKEYIWKTV